MIVADDPLEAHAARRVLRPVFTRSRIRPEACDHEEDPRLPHSRFTVLRDGRGGGPASMTTCARCGEVLP